MEDLAKPKTMKVRRTGEKIEEKQTRQVKMVNPDGVVRYSEQVDIDTHLYKLVEAPVIKYLGKEKENDVHPARSPQDFVAMGHAHIFRTTDSDGKNHTKSVPIAGHYHVLELEYPEGKDKYPVVVSMSGPMRSQSKTVGGRTVLVDVPVNHWDDHVHDVQYLKSETIKSRKTNTEAQVFIASKVAVPPAPSGLGEAGGR